MPCDVIILDLAMPRLDGLGVLRALRERRHAAKILVLSQSAEPGLLEQLAALGVEGQVLKADEPSEILRALDALSGGRRYYSSSAGERYLDLLRGASGPQRETVAKAELTPREREIAALVARGLTNKGIAFALSCSENTVKCHKANLMRKLGARNAAEIGAWAARAGLVTP